MDLENLLNKRAVLITPPNDGDHSAGNRDGRVTLVEYADFECPSSGKAFGLIKNLRRRFGDDLRFIFRHFPLSSKHPNSIPAAMAAQAAGYQGKFWAMHDLLFENQRTLSPDRLLRYAQKIGLDMDEFKKDLNDEGLAEDIKENIRDGIQSDVNRTPTLFINSLKYEGRTDDAEKISQLIRVRMPAKKRVAT